MVCVLDNIVHCDKCGECIKIKHDGCVFDGCRCNDCNECTRIQDCCDWKQI